MDRQRDRHLPGSIGSVWRLARIRGALLGGLPAPLFHNISGSSGFWDEIVTFGLIGAVVAFLGTLVFLGWRGGRQGKRRDKSKGMHRGKRRNR